MDPAVARALARLRAKEGAAVADLARLVVDEAAATPIRDIAEPRWLASQLATGLEAIARGDRPRDRLVARIDEQVATWREDHRLLGGDWPPEVEAPLREALGKPWVPDERLVFRMLDRDVFRDVMREVLDGTLRRFRERLTRLDQGLLRGLGGRAARRSRGLFGNMADTMTGGVVSAVRDEVEGRMDDLVQDFLAGATREGLKVVARHVADPQHAEAYARLRLSLLDGLKETEVSTLVAELEKLDVGAYVDIGVRAVREELDREGFVDRAEERIAALLEEVGDGTLGAWLDEVGLRGSWTDSTTDLLARRLVAVVRTEGFAAWFEGLFAED